MKFQLWSCGRHLNKILNELLDLKQPIAEYDSVTIKKNARGDSVGCQICQKVPPYAEWEISFKRIDNSPDFYTSYYDRLRSQGVENSDIEEMKREAKANKEGSRNET